MQTDANLPESGPGDASLHERYRGARIMLVGAAGFIGRFVADALLRSGAALHAVLRPGEPAAVRDQVPEERIHELDLCVPGGIHGLLDRVRPAVLFNLAGYGVGIDERDEHQARALNVEAVRAMAAALLALDLPAWVGPRLVHVGSAAEYGDVGGDLREQCPAHPVELYGRTKLAGTQALVDLATQHPGFAIVARLFTVYGPGERPGRLLPSLIEAARMQTEVDLSEGTQRRDFTYVEDVAEGLMRLGISTPPEPPIVNVATGRLSSVRSFVEQAARVLGIPDSALRFGVRAGGRFDLEHDPINLERLDRLLGWRPPTDIVEGVGRTLARLAKDGQGGAS